MYFNSWGFCVFDAYYYCLVFASGRLYVYVVRAVMFYLFINFYGLGLLNVVSMRSSANRQLVSLSGALGDLSGRSRTLKGS